MKSNHYFPCWLFIVFFSLMICMIALSPHWLIYDERYHILPTRFLMQGGSLWDLLAAPFESAPGPLYPLLHAWVEPIIGLDAPGTRFLNPMLLLIACWSLSEAIKDLGFSNNSSRAAMLIAVPMIWSTTGLALTEVPALMLASVATALAIKGSLSSMTIGWTLFVLSGLCCGLAILGRQTYLPGVGAYMLVSVSDARHRWASLTAAIIALAICVPVFVVWGGLLPAAQKQLGNGWSIEHGVMAFVYLAATVAIIAPRFFLPAGRLGLICSIVASILIHFTGFHIFVIGAAASKLPNLIQIFFKYFFSIFLCALFFMFVYSLCANIWSRRQDHAFVLFTVLAVIMAGTTFHIVTVFSSRYVLAAFPFALLALQPYYEPNRWASLRLMAGAVFGVASLAAYYWTDLGPVPLPAPSSSAISVTH